jgi:hypothetical protein
MKDSRLGNPMGGQPVHPLPREAILLAAPPQRAQPNTLHVIVECFQRSSVGRHCVVGKEASDHLLDPRPFAPFVTFRYSRTVSGRPFDRAPPWRGVVLRPRGPRSGASYAVSHRHHLIDPIRPAREHIATSPHGGKNTPNSSGQSLEGGIFAIRGPRIDAESEVSSGCGHLPRSSFASRFTAGASDDVAGVRGLGFAGAWVKHSPPKRLRNASAVGASGKQNRI